MHDPDHQQLITKPIMSCIICVMSQGILETVHCCGSPGAGSRNPDAHKCISSFPVREEKKQHWLILGSSKETDRAWWKMQIMSVLTTHPTFLKYSKWEASVQIYLFFLFSTQNYRNKVCLLWLWILFVHSDYLCPSLTHRNTVTFIHNLKWMFYC